MSIVRRQQGAQVNPPSGVISSAFPFFSRGLSAAHWGAALLILFIMFVSSSTWAANAQQVDQDDRTQKMIC